MDGGNEIQGYMWMRRDTRVHVGGGNKIQRPVYNNNNNNNNNKLYLHDCKFVTILQKRTTH